MTLTQEMRGIKYRTIVADPPWPMPSGGPRSVTRIRYAGVPSRSPYESMTLADISALPIGEYADDNAHLYLWTVNAFLEASYGVARGWGFRPSQMLVWGKPPRGLGMGGAFANTTEFILFCRRGSLRPSARTDSTWWTWSRGAHSVKPEAFTDMVEKVSPGPYLELFARRQRIGWDSWGNECRCDVEMSAPKSGAA